MNRIQELETLITKHKALYYQGRPEIEDHEYDSLEDELKNLDPENPVLSIVGSFKINNKIKHDSKMLSLNKTYKPEELVTWANGNDVLSTFKIDGVSCSLIYKSGKLFQAKTRGDGSHGEDITEKVKWMPSVPKKIYLEENIEIRGELFTYEEDFYKLTEEMLIIGLERPTSQRNIVAGLIGRKENLELNRYITFKAFEFISKRQLEFEEDKYKLLEENGFKIPNYDIHKSGKNFEEIISSAKEFMSNGNFQIDGIVFCLNRLSLHEELGATAHHPRYKIAFKFAGESKITTLKKIIWSVSRNGVLTPVGDVEAVELSGAKITRVTLHNYGLVNQHKLKSGDQIEIIRSGEVIPKFLSVKKSSTEEYKIPEKCPSCNEKIDIVDIRLICNNPRCPGKILESILYFVQKMGIDDLSSKRLNEFIKNGLINEISDLYKIKSEDLLKLDKVQEKLATKLVNAINKSRNVDLITFMTSLGISGGGRNKIEKIFHSGVKSLDKFKNLNSENLQNIESFAQKSSEEFIQSFKSKLPLIESLEKVGFQFKEVKLKETKLTGKKICITGTLSEKRSSIEDKIRNVGGIIVSSVTKNTDYLLCNDENSSSSKMKKAKALNTQIISEKKLESLIS